MCLLLQPASGPSLYYARRPVTLALMNPKTIIQQCLVPSAFRCRKISCLCIPYSTLIIYLSLSQTRTLLVLTMCLLSLDTALLTLALANTLVKPASSCCSSESKKSANLPMFAPESQARHSEIMVAAPTTRRSASLSLVHILGEVLCTLRTQISLVALTRLALLSLASGIPSGHFVVCLTVLRESTLVLLPIFLLSYFTGEAPSQACHRRFPQ